MKRSCLALVLLGTAVVAGCEKSSAVPNPTSSPLRAETSLPEEAPSRFTANKLPALDIASRTIPAVALSARHARWCVAKVGDEFPTTELPRLEGQRTKLATLYGKQATVIVFWQDDRWMSRMALEDIDREVASAYDPQEVAVVGIFEGRSPGFARKLRDEVGAKFLQLVDSSGSAFAEVGSISLPRVYVLDPTGKIVWFDIEYSESTRRELAQTLDVLTASN